MQPATLGLLRTAFPADRLNMPIAVRSAVIAASTAAGPVVGGLLVEHASWSWVFFLNVPLGRSPWPSASPSCATYAASGRPAAWT
ncbi:hypothetical protein Scinn_00010 [Streptomyces virginiae]|uniref:Major facilitator superfamily (MFS) profile domain-containing protein n=2 Tax=Streptomyces virginiae TaxID=1961 RepID=A0ABQ3NCQ6_STRVG|nr:hypothetical protein Scinn_00010 [Streptomyces virginiae]